jgi:hypothetical protein
LFGRNPYRHTPYLYKKRVTSDLFWDRESYGWKTNRIIGSYSYSKEDKAQRKNKLT